MKKSATQKKCHTKCVQYENGATRNSAKSKKWNTKSVQQKKGQYEKSATLKKCKVVLISLRDFK